MAFRLADNKTGEKAKFNIALLKSECKRLGNDIDMSRFNIDYKSKLKPYGAESLKTDDYYNLQLIIAGHCTSGKLDMPKLNRCDFAPKSLTSFNYAKSATKFDTTLLFFVDDYQFERLWNSP